MYVIYISVIIMFSVGEVFCLLLVAILWEGTCTNPFMKKCTEGIEGVQKDNKLLQFLAEVKFFKNLFGKLNNFSQTNVI
uniref:Uncharacterized protein n=1 Tax=Sinocyclocheilus grahami TaxID=75366 RepID=A0A672P076_SINGR